MTFQLTIRYRKPTADSNQLFAGDTVKINRVYHPKVAV